jgi:mannose-6-phosphate isomerase-like protein (cupin superfamily)
MSDTPVLSEITEGDGWAAGPLDAMGEGWGFRKVRASLGVTAFGVNALVLPPRYQAGVHYHDEQEELYLVLEGDVELEFGDGAAVVRLAPGGLARVDAGTHRRLRNVGHEDATVLVVGGKDGYVGRDGRRPGDDDGSGGPPGAQGGPLDG